MFCHFDFFGVSKNNHQQYTSATRNQLRTKDRHGRSFRAFDSCKIVANQLSSLNLLDMVVEQLNDGCDVLRSGFTVETSFNAMQTILSLLGPVIQTYNQGKPDDFKKRTHVTWVLEFCTGVFFLMYVCNKYICILWPLDIVTLAHLVGGPRDAVATTRHTCL